MAKNHETDSHWLGLNLAEPTFQVWVHRKFGVEPLPHDSGRRFVSEVFLVATLGSRLQHQNAQQLVITSHQAVFPDLADQIDAKVDPGECAQRWWLLQNAKDGGF